ncbi:MAG: hypothetical protein AAF846_26490 [Chloroflexota bacterium]
MTQKWDYTSMYCAVTGTVTSRTLTLFLVVPHGDQELHTTISFSNDAEMVEAWYECFARADKELFDATEAGWELVAVTQHPLQVVVAEQSMRTFPAYYFKIKHEDA